jgi:hypothetical protein
MFLPATRETIRFTGCSRVPILRGCSLGVWMVYWIESSSKGLDGG